MGSALFGTSNQWWVFLFMVYGGIILGLLYDLMAAVRALLRARRALGALFDLLYWLAATAIAFTLLYLAGQGEFRVFNALGFGIGAALYFLGPGKLLQTACKWLVRRWRVVLVRLKGTAFFRFLMK